MVCQMRTWLQISTFHKYQRGQLRRLIPAEPVIHVLVGFPADSVVPGGSISPVRSALHVGLAVTLAAAKGLDAVAAADMACWSAWRLAGPGALAAASMAAVAAGPPMLAARSGLAAAAEARGAGVVPACSARWTAVGRAEGLAAMLAASRGRASAELLS